jgi:hypothetical protein
MLRTPGVRIPQVENHLSFRLPSVNICFSILQCPAISMHTLFCRIRSTVFLLVTNASFTYMATAVHASIREKESSASTCGHFRVTASVWNLRWRNSGVCLYLPGGTKGNFSRDVPSGTRIGHLSDTSKEGRSLRELDRGRILALPNVRI